MAYYRLTASHRPASGGPGFPAPQPVPPPSADRPNPAPPVVNTHFRRKTENRGSTEPIKPQTEQPRPKQPEPTDMPMRPRITDVPRLAEAPPAAPPPVIPVPEPKEPPPRQHAVAPMALESAAQPPVVMEPQIPAPIEETKPPAPQLEPLLFEIAWEVCWQLGGIYTVLRSKAPPMLAALGRPLLPDRPLQPADRRRSNSRSSRPTAHPRCGRRAGAGGHPLPLTGAG